MTTACVIPFFHYHGTSPDTSSKLYTFFLKHLEKWRSEVDTVYVLDSGNFLYDAPGVTRIVVDRASHWDNLNNFIPSIHEEAFIILDSDMVIYREGVIKGIFEDLKIHHIVSILDNSGSGLDARHHILRANKNRDVRQRLCPYLFGVQTSFFKLIDYDFTPQPAEGYIDSMSKITDQLLSLGATLKELPDDRTTIYFNNGDFKVSQWLDSPTFEWSKRVNPDYGYYHLRNAGLGLYATDSFLNNKEAWLKVKEITPLDELLRALTWTGHYSEVPFYQIIIDDLKIDDHLYADYYKLYRHIYKWLYDLFPGRFDTIYE